MEMFIWIWKLKFKRLHEIATTNHTTAAHRLSHKFERHLPRKPFSNGKMCLHVINIKRNELLIDKQSSVHDTHRHGEIVCLCAYANLSKLNEPIQFSFFLKCMIFRFQSEYDWNHDAISFWLIGLEIAWKFEHLRNACWKECRRKNNQLWKNFLGKLEFGASKLYYIWHHWEKRIRHSREKCFLKGQKVVQHRQNTHDMSPEKQRWSTLMPLSTQTHAYTAQKYLKLHKAHAKVCVCVSE